MPSPCLTGPPTTPAAEHLSVAVVAASRTIRAGLVRLASRLPDLEVSLQLPSVAQLPPPPAGPPLAVVDATWLRSAALSRRFWAMMPARTRVVLVCRRGEPPSMPEAIHAGVRAMIVPDSTAGDLRRAVDTAMSNSVYVSAGLISGLLGAPGEHPARLSPRETEALALIAGGLTNPKVGERMGVTVSTADTYAQRIRAKLKVTTRTQLVARAIELGYLSPAGTLQ